MTGEYLKIPDNQAEPEQRGLTLVYNCRDFLTGRDSKEELTSRRGLRTRYGQIGGMGIRNGQSGASSSPIQRKIIKTYCAP
jgi:hypothetical protein